VCRQGFWVIVLMSPKHRYCIIFSQVRILLGAAYKKNIQCMLKVKHRRQIATPIL